MSDEIIRELWQVKDGIAQEHGCDIETLVAHLQTRPRPAGQRVVDLRAMREIDARSAPEDADKPR